MKRQNQPRDVGNSKRFRSIDEDEPSFEEELGMMIDAEAEMLSGEQVAALDDQCEVNQRARWVRPECAGWNAKERDLAFHWLDIDMYSSDPLQANPDGKEVLGSTIGPVPVIRMYGVTADGHSVVANVHGFTPYFYVSFPNSVDISDAALGQLRTALDDRVSRPIPSSVPVFSRVFLDDSFVVFAAGIRSFVSEHVEMKRVSLSACSEWKEQNPCRACWATTSTK